MRGQETNVIKFVLGDGPKKSKSGTGADAASRPADKTKEMELEEAVRDLKISYITKYVYRMGGGG